MKYRILTTDELAALETDLKAFLIVNGLDADAWKNLNEQEPEKAVAIVEAFSDAVLQVVYERIEYLEFRGENSVMVFHVGKELTELISLNWPEELLPDLSTPEGIHDAILRHSDAMKWFTSQKPTGIDREKEVHRMLQQGCIPSSKAFWNSLKDSIQ